MHETGPECPRLCVLKVALLKKSTSVFSYYVGLLVSAALLFGKLVSYYYKPYSHDATLRGRASVT